MSPRATPDVRAWTAARDAKPVDWSEDACRYELAGGADAWSAFLVVADGAGSTAFPGEWARALVDAADRDWLDGGLAEGIATVRSSFDPLVDAEYDEDDFLLDELWYEKGSAATLLLAEAVHARGRTRCRVVSVGDSIAVVSAPGGLKSFPLSASNEFTNRTATVRTATTGLDARTWSCDLPPGSMLVLASDGIGRWLLQQSERDGPGWVHRRLRTFSDTDIPDVEDDVTLLILDVPEDVGMVEWLFRQLRVGRPPSSWRS